MSNITKEFDILNQWLGWGEPKDGLWFIGIEEGGTWECETLEDLEKSRTEIRRRSGKQFTSYLNKNERGNINWPVAVVTAKICSLVTQPNIDWRDYQENRLWLKGSKIFNANLLPLGKSSLNLNAWPDCYKELFGFTRDEYLSYYHYVKQSRYKLFINFMQEYKPQAVVCYGKKYWNDYEQLFVRGGDIAIDYNDFKTKVYEKSRVILTRHFSNGMPDKIVNFIANQLNKWDILI